jgi:hypothetical protein
LAALSSRLASSPRIARLILGAWLACAGAQARADAGWFESGDTQLRMDLQLLNDANIIRLPVNQWPLPRAAVTYALAHARVHLATSAAVRASLDRVRLRTGISDAGEKLPRQNLTLHANALGGQPGLWRDFDTLGREDAELNAGVSYSEGRYSAGLSATWVLDPDDGHDLRLDGSHADVQLGNWLFSAHELDRWWGPGHEGSLILSNNARPMPTLMLERAEAQPFETRWLSWLGPWRMSFGMSRMETQRLDIQKPLFMAWRFSLMPFKDIELGLSRTAQFCGTGLECNLHVFKNLLIGNDNVGIDTTAAEEPGNQMAGFDLRWNSPIGHLPYALYGQYIGEDESGYIPAKFLAQLGLEIWHPMADGGLLQYFTEYANTACSGFLTNRGPYYDCAYNQGRFDIEGYRYHHRVIGYTSDRDADNYAVGAIYSRGDGSLWTGTARFSRLNHDDFGDTYDTVASVPTRYGALELGWRGTLFGEPISVDLGVQSTEPAGESRNTEAFGFVSWRHDFAP